MHSLAHRLGVATVVGIVVQVSIRIAVGLGGLVAFGATESTQSALPTIWAVLGALFLLSPLAGCILSYPFIRGAGSSFSATAAGAYAGLGVVAAWAWWFRGHSAEPILMLLWFFPVPGGGAGIGAFIGATSRAALPRREKIMATIIALVLGCLAAMIFTCVFVDANRRVRIRESKEQQRTENVAGRAA